MSAGNSCDVCRVSRTRPARFITGTRKYDHITPVLRNLHWLPVRQRIIFKIATLMYRCLNGLAPSYLAADCIVVSAIPGRRQLRSATSGQLYVPRTRTVTFGPRSFKVCGPTIWNELPASMKDPSLSFDSFRKLLKTFLFDKWLLHERICGSRINLRGEMFIIIIIIIITSIDNFSLSHTVFEIFAFKVFSSVIFVQRIIFIYSVQDEINLVLVQFLYFFRAIILVLVQFLFYKSF